MPLTNLKLWYNEQTAQKRTEFKKHVIEACGIDERTFYRYLTFEAPKLTKHLIADYCKISFCDLYKTAIIKFNYG